MKKHKPKQDTRMKNQSDAVDAEVTDKLSDELEPDEQMDSDDQPQLSREQELEQQLADLESRYLRCQADYQNFQRRARQSEDEARKQASAGVIQTIIPVLDSFDMAFQHNTEDITVPQMLDGIRAIHAEFIRVLSVLGVSLISPEPDDSFDPACHQAMLHQQSDDIQPGHVVCALQVGYKLHDRVVRPAKVSVASGDEQED